MRGAQVPQEGNTMAEPSKPTNQVKRLPVIGIVPSQNTTEKLVSFPERYANAIIKAGGAPLLLPLTGNSHVYETLFPLIDGFVLTGGNDIDPARYGAIRDSGKIDEHTPEREELEYLILSYAYRFDLPLMGICRGMQMINVCLGGTLYRDLGDQFPGAVRPGVNDGAEELPQLVHWQPKPYSEPTHPVTIMPNTKLSNLLGAGTIMVNSMHHQGVCDLSTRVDAAAYAPDGLVEAIEVRDRKFMIGVQWHPEFFTGRHRMECVFDALINAAAQGRKHCQERGSVAITRSEPSGVHAQWPAITFADCI